MLHQALFDVLGDEIRQEGSNITGERLRFDYYSTKKPTDEEIKKVESIMNEKINSGLPVEFKILPKTDAENWVPNPFSVKNIRHGKGLLNW